jgi:required for meiotic nuclear division protein 1
MKDLPSQSGLPSEIVVKPGAGMRVRADYFHGRIDLKSFRLQNPHFPVLMADPLVVEPEQGVYAVLTKFGGLVCWNCSDDVQQQLRSAVAALPDSHDRSEEVSDEIEVVIGGSEDPVEFERIAVRKLTRETLKIISLALAQSVALEYFENRVREALGQSEPIVILMRRQGRLGRKEKEIVQAVGFALEGRSAVLAKLTLFDSPPEAWESDALDRLDARLYDYFDLEERLDAIKEKVGYLTDLNSTLLTLLSSRKSRYLEWIVIILIAVEIILFAYMELLRR